MLSFETNYENTLRGKKTSVEVFGYNSAEIEWIWMKSAAL